MEDNNVPEEVRRIEEHLEEYIRSAKIVERLAKFEGYQEGRNATLGWVIPIVIGLLGLLVSGIILLRLNSMADSSLQAAIDEILPKIEETIVSRVSTAIVVEVADKVPSFVGEAVDEEVSTKVPEFVDAEVAQVAPTALQAIVESQVAMEAEEQVADQITQQVVTAVQEQVTQQVANEVGTQVATQMPSPTP